MTLEVPYYSTLVVFGKEHVQSILSPALFRQTVSALAAFIGSGDCTLKCRGYIAGHRARNVAPRKGLLNARKMDEWLQALNSGTFMSCEIFDGAWSDTHFPVVYANLHKLWGYTPQGYIERTKEGPENTVTVALQRHLIADHMQTLEDYGRTLTSLLTGFYGFIELNVQWDREEAPGLLLRDDMVNYRWTNRVGRDYKGGLYKMDAMIPRLYWGNILSRAHFKAGNPDALPSEIVGRLEQWGDDLFYLRFVRDPQADEQWHNELASYFNMIPEKGWFSFR